MPPEQQPREVIANESQQRPSVEHTVPGMFNSGENAREEHTDYDDEAKSTWGPEQTEEENEPRFTCVPEQTDEENVPKSTWVPETPTPDSSAIGENSSESGGHHQSTNASQTRDLGAPPEHTHDGMKPKSKFSKVKTKMVGYRKRMASSPGRLFSRIKKSAL